MSTYEYCISGRCRIGNTPHTPDSTSIAITASVGATGSNRNQDVKAIQKALNQIPVTQGGPSPSLTVDGWMGPKTQTAITFFQRTQFPGWKPDGRVDPAQKTIARLNALLASRRPMSAPTSHFGSVLPAGATTDKSLDWFTSACLLLRQRAFKHWVEVQQALNDLRTVRAAYASRTPDNSYEKRNADWHFKFYRSANPVRDIDFVIGVYTRIHEMLGRFHFYWAPGQAYDLCRPGDNRADAVAYTPGGGYYYGNDEIDAWGLGRHVYLTKRINESNADKGVLVHELAHFCGPRNGSLVVDHSAVPDPYPVGTPYGGGHNFRDMTSSEALVNAFSYQMYAVTFNRRDYPVPEMLP